jgi:DNA-directed RNA polymerase subunit N (RpoN/RPB10)
MIPIKCFSCGKVLADKYRLYQSEVIKLKGHSDPTVEYFSVDNIHKTPEAIIMDELNVIKICCRRHLLTHVEPE